MASTKRNWEFRYRIKPDHLLFGKLPNLQNLKFDSEEKDGTKRLVGFTIKIKNSTLKRGEDIANLKATRLVNYLSGVYPRHFSVRLAHVESNWKGGTKHTKFFMEIRGDVIFSINIKDSPIKLQSLLKNDSRLNQKLAHFNRGLEASDNSDPITMIKEFYQVFDEEKDKKKIEKYRLIRHLLSHPILNDPRIKNIRKKYPKLKFDSRPTSLHLDITSQKNLNELRKIADDLKQVATKQLQLIMKK